jgi:sedoheptulokinase
MKIVGIDIGTTSLSFVIMDTEDGILQKRLTVKNNAFITAAKPYENIQDPEQIWILVKQVMEAWNLEKENIRGIGLTGQMHGILYVDAQGHAVSPLYTWQDASGEQLYQNGKTYVQQLSDLTGYALATGFGAVTYYVHQVTGTVPAEAVSFCTIMDYIGMKLTGRKTPLTDATNAASLGLFDLEHLNFDRAEIEKAGLMYEMFPAVTIERSVLGYTSQGIPVITAIGDNQASFLGAVKSREKSILVNVGTGSQISFMVPSYMEITGMETRPFVDSQYLLVNSSLCGGRAYALLADFFQRIIKGFAEYTNMPYEADKDMIYGWMNELLDKHFESIQKDKHRIEIFPVFSGTRSDPSVRGSVTGIGISSIVPEMFIYGMLEGIVGELYHAFDLCGQNCKSGKEFLVGSGNGIRKNPHLQKLFENAFGLPLVLSENEEEAACGAAIYCGEVF